MGEKKNRENMKGFTLVELLAVIAIIAVIFSIAGYAVSIAIKHSKDKTTNVSYESIMQSAALYVKEYSAKRNSRVGMILSMCVLVFQN